MDETLRSIAVLAAAVGMASCLFSWSTMWRNRDGPQGHRSRVQTIARRSARQRQRRIHVSSRWRRATPTRSPSSAAVESRSKLYLQGVRDHGESKHHRRRLSCSQRGRMRTSANQDRRHDSAFSSTRPIGSHPVASFASTARDRGACRRSQWSISVRRQQHLKPSASSHQRRDGA